MKNKFLIPLIAAGVVGLVFVASLATKAENLPSILTVDGKNPNAQNTVIDPISATPLFQGVADANALVSVFNQLPPSEVGNIEKISGEDEMQISRQVTPAAAFFEDFAQPYLQNWYTNDQNYFEQIDGKIKMTAAPSGQGSVVGLSSNTSLRYNGGDFSSTFTVVNPDPNNPQVSGPSCSAGNPPQGNNDQDNDGIADEFDQCPSQPGPGPSGCPSGGPGGGQGTPEDFDGDGVLNENDQCPTSPGPASNGGCPTFDQDGDGITGGADVCSTVPGVASNGGCPEGDIDQDGLVGPQDSCPDVPGDISNNGCPLQNPPAPPEGGPVSATEATATIAEFNQSTPSVLRAGWFFYSVQQNNQSNVVGEISANVNANGQVNLSGSNGINLNGQTSGFINNSYGFCNLKLAYEGGRIVLYANNTPVITTDNVNLPQNVEVVHAISLAQDGQYQNPTPATLFLDDISSSLEIAGSASYSFARTGMSFDGVDYMDPATLPFLPDPSAPGVFLWSNNMDIQVLPQAQIDESYFQSDIYVLLSTMTIPQGAFGGNPELKVRWTNYASSPQAFAQIVRAISTQFGLPTTVDAYSKAFTKQNTDFAPQALPFVNLGTITENGQILPPSEGRQLIARAYTSTTGSWEARYGKDENGAFLPGFDATSSLLSIGQPPYAFLVQAVKNGTTLYSEVLVTAGIVSENTDTEAPVTTATTAGTAQAAPYSTYYENQATVTLAATDENGGSGVQNIEYSLSGATDLAWAVYAGPVVITAAGETTVSFKATDNAGNGESIQTLAVRIDKDTDGDLVYNNFDSCVATVGSTHQEGCPYSLRMLGTLKVKYEGKTPGYAVIQDGKQKRENKLPLKVAALGDSGNETLETITAKVFKQSTLSSIYGKNYAKMLKNQCSAIFENDQPVATKNIVNGDEYIGVGAKDDYILAVRIAISEPGSSTQVVSNTCNKVSKSKFRWTPVDGDLKKVKRQDGGTVARPRVKFTKTVKSPRPSCFADDNQDGPDHGEEDDDRD